MKKIVNYLLYIGSSRKCGFLCTQIPYKDTSPPLGTDVTKELKSIYGHDAALVAVWLMVNKFPHPDERTTKYGPLDAIWFITFYRPERMMTQNGRVTSHKNSKKFKNSIFKKKNSKIQKKNQYLDRYIPGSSTCSTKELSITMTKMLHAVKGGLLSYCDKVYSRGNINQKHCIGGIMVSVLASSVVDHGFEPRSNQEL
jgi:hypothetical protein